MQRVRAAALAILFTSMLAAPANAEKSTTGQPPMKGVQFTNVQDLDPNKKSENIPIKQKWAVVVGVSKFKEGRLASDDLLNSKAAHEFGQFLLDPNGGRFSEKHVRVLTNTKATKENVLTTLGSSWLGPLAGPDDLVVVFISTSSFPTTDGGAYLCAYDCALDNVYGTCFSMQDLMSTLRKNVKAKRIVLVLQAAYSGAADLGQGSKALSKSFNIDPAKLIAGSGYIVLSSSKPNQMSWGNIFSHNLIEALKEEGGLVPLSKAFEKAKKKTELDTTSYAGRYTAKQTPVFKSEWKGKDLSLGTPAIADVQDIPADVSGFLAAEAHYFRANDALTKGDVDTAMQEYQKAIETDPKYAAALSDYATVLALKGDNGKAAELYVRAITEKPDEALYRANYARVLERLGRSQECMKELEKAYQLNPKDKVVLTALASRLLAGKDAPGAASILEEAVALYPKSSDLHNRLSFALAQSGRIGKAVEHANAAVNLDPKSANARINLGSTLLLDGNTAGAMDAYKAAVKIDPKNANAHYLLSQTYEKAGLKDDARSALKTFIELAPIQDPRRAKAEQMLGRM